MSQELRENEQENIGKVITDGWFAESMKALDEVFRSAEKIIESRKEETK